MAEKAEKGSWLSFWAKLAFLLIVFIAVILSVLNALGGNSDVLKSSLEQYLSGALRGNAKIEKLHQMTFFPYMSIDAEGVTVSDPKNERRIIFSAGRMQMAMGFWDMTFSTGKIKTFNVEKLRAMPGVFVQPGLTVGSAAIIDEGDQAYIRAEGKIGAEPFKMGITTDTYGSGKSKTYRMGIKRDVKIKIGDIELDGIVDAADPENYILQDFSLKHDTLVIKGGADIFAGSGGRIKIKGDFILPGGSHIKPDILFEHPENKLPRAAGAIMIEGAKAADFTDAAPYKALWDSLARVTQGGGESSAKAKTFGWTGDFEIMAGPGELPQSFLGQGMNEKLIPAMIPGEAGRVDILAVNCLRFDLSVSRRVLEGADIFVDTKDFIAGGAGSYAVDEDRLEASLVPKMKNAGTDAMAVKISGPWKAYEVDPVSADPKLVPKGSCADMNFSPLDAP